MSDVDFFAVSSILDFLPTSTLKREQLIESGTYPVVNSGRDYYGYFENFNNHGNSFTVASRGEYAGYVSYHESQYWAGGLCYSLRSKDESKLLTKFCFYYFKNIEHKIMANLVSRGSIPALNKTDIEKILIPIPNIDKQQEIVRILDTFTTLEAELEAELEARKKQYSFYTNHLFDFEELNRSVEYRKIEDVCLSISSGGTPLTSMQDYYKGDIPWLRTQEVDFGEIFETSMHISEEALKNSSAKWIPVNCVIVAMYGATAAKVAINKIPLTTNQACCNLSVNEDIAHYKFVYYWLVINYENLKSLGQGSQSNLNARVIRDYLIPIPPLDIQQYIVKILDQFDTLVNDLSQGLPAEIAARRKQYEYYRNKLLTFKEVKHESI